MNVILIILFLESGQDTENVILHLTGYSIYKVSGQELILFLTRTGTHSNLFGI